MRSHSQIQLWLKWQLASRLFMWVERSTITQKEGVNGHEVICTYLPPDAIQISPESHTTPPSRLPFRALVVTFTIYILCLFVFLTKQRFTLLA